MNKELKDVFVALSLILLIIIVFFVLNSQVKEVEVVKEIDYEKKVLESGAIVGQAQHRGLPERVISEEQKRLQKKMKETRRDQFRKENVFTEEENDDKEREDEKKLNNFEKKPDEGVRSDKQAPSKEEIESRKRNVGVSRSLEFQENQVFLSNCKQAILDNCYDNEVPMSVDKKGIVYHREFAMLTDINNQDLTIFTEKGDVYQEGVEFETLYECSQRPDYCKESNLIEKLCQFDQQTQQFEPQTYGLQPYSCECGCANGACITCVPGCTDQNADNFNDLANQENNFCTYTFDTCNDKEADNYENNVPEGFSCDDEEVTCVDDGSCLFTIPGCTDNKANNFKEEATVDDGSCLYFFGTCKDEEADNTFHNIPEGLICDQGGVNCIDDGSCIYLGCTNNQAENYDEKATVDDGSCIISAPDLYVKQIYETVKSEQCLNSFHFEICNQGDLDVVNEFNLKVSGNDVDKIYSVKQNKLPIQVDECLYINVPALFHIGSFGFGLDQLGEIVVSLDINNEIIEEDETNNQLMGTSYTGDDYYYTEGEVCDAFCFETDLGTDYQNYGELTFKYVGEIKEIGDVCNPWDDNKLGLWEQSCVLPIIKKNNGKFSNPHLEGDYNCLIQEKKCENAECVPLNIYCEDAYGELVPCLQCTDYETDYVIEDGVIIGWAGDKTNPFDNGKIEWTNIDNEFKEIYDVCSGQKVMHPTEPNKWGSEFVQDNFCYGFLGKYNLKNYNYISCYRFDDGNADTEFYCGGNGEVDSGVCTPCTAKDYETGFCVEQTCEGPKENELDDFKKDKVIFHKLLGEVKTEFDSCFADGDKVRQYFCDTAGKFFDSKSTNCDQILDENGFGASCVDGRCTFFDESLKSCEEYGDQGIDMDNSSEIEYVTGYGKEDWDGDHCKNDDILIETYCVGNDNKITEISCANEGKTCSNGACKIGNPDLMMCDDSDNGKDILTSGEVGFVNKFGDNNWNDDYCVDVDGDYVGWDGISTHVKEQFCEGKEPKEEIIACPNGLSCYNDKCQEVNLDQVSCVEHPEVENMVIMTWPDGEVSNEGAFCQWDEEFLFKPYCTINDAGLPDYDENEIICTEGSACMKFKEIISGESYWTAKCVAPDESLKSCQDVGYLDVIDEFGEYTDIHDECVDGNGFFVFESPFLKDYSCDESEFKSEIITCPENSLCGFGKCLDVNYDNMVCQEIGDAVTGVDEFGSDYVISKSCKMQGTKIYTPQCDGNKEGIPDIYDCLENEMCHPYDIICKPYDENLISCEGPSEPNIYVKSGITGNDGFGEPFNFIDDGINFGSQDICFTDLDISQEIIDEIGPIPNNVGFKFWCEGKEPAGDNFKCPAGEICNDGICVEE